MSDTRKKLLVAAEAEFREKGWDATSGVGIRKRAKVSNGSWVHAFPDTKIQVAEEIYVPLHASLWGDPIVALTAAGPGAAPEPNLLRTMTSLLSSVEVRPDDWRLLFQLEDGLAQRGLAAVPTGALQRRRLVVQEWVGRCRGEIVGDPNNPLLYPIVFGPTLMTVRAWLEHPERDTLKRWAGPLVDAAIAGLMETGALTPIGAGPRRRRPAGDKPPPLPVIIPQVGSKEVTTPKNRKG